MTQVSDSTNSIPGGSANQSETPSITQASLGKEPLSRQMQHILCLDDFEDAARRYLPKPIFGYIAGASENNTSLKRNRQSFDDYSFIPRALVDISKRSQSVSLFGQDYAAPFGIAPLGISALSAYRGDIVFARAAKRAGVPMVMSGSSLIRLEDVADTNRDAWFQAYLPGDIPSITALIERVEDAGFSTLCVRRAPVQPCVLRKHHRERA